MRKYAFHAGSVLLVLLLLVFFLIPPKKVEVIKKVTITPTVTQTPTPTIPSFFRGFSSSPVLEHPTPVPQQPQQVNNSTTIQNPQNTPSNGSGSTPAPTPVPSPTNSPLLLCVGKLCL